MDVAGCRGLHLAGGHLHLVKRVFDLAANLARPKLVDAAQLLLLDLPHIPVECILGCVSKDLNLEVWQGVRQLVPLADDAPLALLHVGRLPRDVQVMQGDQALLHVRPRAHLLRGSEHDPDRSGVDLLEQRRLLVVRVVVVDESDLAFRDPALNQRGLQVVVDGESALGGPDGVEPIVALLLEFRLRLLSILNLGHGILVPERSHVYRVFVSTATNPLLQRLILGEVLLGMLDRRAKVAEHKLGALVLVPLLVSADNLFCRTIDAGALLSLGDAYVDEPNIHCRLSSISGYRKMVVFSLLGRPFAPLNRLCPCGNFLHVCDLRISPIQRDRLTLPGLQLGKRKLLSSVLLTEGSLDVLHGHRVGDLVIHRQKLMGVVELLKRLDVLMGSCCRCLDRVFDSRKGVRPCVERTEAGRLHHVRHHVPHHVVHLGKRVADRGTGQEHNALTAAILRVKLVDLDEHIVGALRPVRVPKPADVLHLRGEHQVLEHVRLVHEQLVNTNLLKVEKVIHWLIAQARNAVLETLLHRLKLLDRPLAGHVLSAVGLCRADGVHDLLDLLLVEGDLEVR